MKKLSVKRNIKRFLEDFMFQMTEEELKEWKSQNVISNKERMRLRKLPIPRNPIGFKTRYSGREKCFEVLRCSSFNASPIPYRVDTNIY